MNEKMIKGNELSIPIGVTLVLLNVELMLFSKSGFTSRLNRQTPMIASTTYNPQQKLKQEV